jgi:ubiquinone/menaquinone biosynthesis C-methylase UbiE
VNANEATLIWVDEYSRMAESYDRNVAPRFEPIANEVVRLSEPKPGELFLDVGTGTGLLACLLAPRILPQGVIAIDLADGAISVASYRAGSAGIRNIRFEMLDSRNIVYRGKLFDAVASNLGMPDLGYDRVFQEVYRVLKPGGRFVFSEWGTEFPMTFTAPRALMGTYGTLTPSKDLAQIREARKLIRDDPEAQALGDPASVLKAFSVAGFDRAHGSTKTFPVRFQDLDEFMGYTASWGWCERELREMTPEGRAKFDAELSARLVPNMTANGIEDSWTVHFYIARKE